MPSAEFRPRFERASWWVMKSHYLEVLPYSCSALDPSSISPALKNCLCSGERSGKCERVGSSCLLEAVFLLGGHRSQKALVCWLRAAAGSAGSGSEHAVRSPAGRMHQAPRLSVGSSRAQPEGARKRKFPRADFRSTAVSSGSFLADPLVRAPSSG